MTSVTWHTFNNGTMSELKEWIRRLQTMDRESGKDQKFTLKIVADLVMDSENRRHIHQFCADCQLYSRTLRQDGKICVIITSTASVDPKTGLTDEELAFFVKIVNLPVEKGMQYDHRRVLYIINLVSRFQKDYQPGVTTFAQWFEYYKKLAQDAHHQERSVPEYETYAIQKLAHQLVANPHYVRFNERVMKYMEPLKVPCVKGKYEDSVGFGISVDMKCANFSSLVSHYPKIFDGAKTWDEYVGKVNGNPFFHNKMVRQRFFGLKEPLINSRKIGMLEKSMVTNVAHVLIQSGVLHTGMMSNDEIVVFPQEGEDIAELFNRVHYVVEKSEFPHLWRVELFHKKPLLPHPMETFNPIVVRTIDCLADINKLSGVDLWNNHELAFSECKHKLEFKNGDRRWLPQILRYFYHEEPTEEDLKISLEGQVFTLDRPLICWSKDEKATVNT